MDSGLAVNFLVALFAIANPIGKVPLWLQASHGEDKPVRLRLSLLVLLTAGGVLLVSLWAGQSALELFNIDLPSFRIGGGIVILLLAINMLHGKATSFDTNKDSGRTPMEMAKSRFRRVVVPMAIPLIAGPGSISTTVVYSSKADGLMDYLLLTGVLIGTLFVIFVTLHYARYVERLAGKVGMEIVTRLFGLILCGIAIQLMVEGLGEVFPNWVTPASEIADDVKNAGG